jgi:hypothetical protein
VDSCSCLPPNSRQSDYWSRLITRLTIAPTGRNSNLVAVLDIDVRVLNTGAFIDAERLIVDQDRRCEGLDVPVRVLCFI